MLIHITYASPQVSSKYRTDISIILHIVTVRREVAQGNVFTGDCHSVHWGKGGVWQTPSRQTPLSRHPQADTPLGRHPLGRHPPGQTHPQADIPLGR